jgi:hypothetical protein
MSEPKRAEHNRRKLADLLIAHHLRMSVPSTAGRDRLVQTYGDESFPVGSFPVGMMERGTRCIAVVGAGASRPLLSRGDELAKELETDLGRDDVELERLERVHNLKKDAFETRLVALSKNESAARQVRETISQKYDIEHPTLLAYELLAHLLKHRFIDAIISFNFDELLDRSLEDELAADEYKRVVFERDCRDLVADPYRADYVPLYIKLHGTASEPNSLRFTPEDYYSLPPRIVGSSERLMTAEHCVVLNVGFGLASFDFQRLLALPRTLRLFELSVVPVGEDVCEKIEAERRKREDSRPAEQENEGEGNRKIDYKWLRICNDSGESGGEQLRALLQTMEDRAPRLAGEMLPFRSVKRHQAVAALLGPDRLPPNWASEPDCWMKEREKYSYRRAILELAFAGAKARGLLSLGPLATDRVSHYYDKYRQLAGAAADDWEALCSAAGLQVSQDTPDRLVSRKHLREEPNAPRVDKETASLHRFNPQALADHILPRVKNKAPPQDRQLLIDTLAYLQKETEIELRTRDDRVCTKAFRNPVTLATATAQEVYTWLILRNLCRSDDAVFISDENGEWLLRKAISDLLQHRKRFEVLLAFGDKRECLEEMYPNIKIRVANPWHHNRHMVIVCDADNANRAIYFARRLRSPVVTPVYLRETDDAQQLERIFHERWEELNTEALADELTMAAERMLSSTQTGYVEGQDLMAETDKDLVDYAISAFHEVERRRAFSVDGWGVTQLPRVSLRSAP